MDSNTQITVNAIAADAAPKVGIDINSIVQIITTFLPIALQCLALVGGGQSPKSFVADHYDETSGKYDDCFVQGNRRNMRVSARQNGHKHLSSEQLDILTVSAFDKARTSDDATVTAVMAEATAV